jgi:hypothetical protein
MPFTPFHFGPHTCVALPLERYIDLPVFVRANVAVDIEPLTIWALKLNLPLHAYCHTFLIGGAVGLLWGAAAYPLRGYFAKFMAREHLRYSTGFLKMMISGMLGVWLHVIFDGSIYPEMKPFWPMQGNPLVGYVSEWAVYAFCAACFIPAGMIWMKKVKG